MQRKKCHQLVKQAQEGDDNARELLIGSCRKFIYNTAVSYCRRPLNWSNDDELSISLIAFNEAVDSFKSDEGKSFLSYARMVIQRRLVDYFRKEKKHHQSRPLILEGEEEVSPPSPEIAAARERYLREEENWNRRQEIILLEKELGHYGITLNDLEEQCPKHQDTRERLELAARVLSRNPQLLNRLTGKKRLPIQELRRHCNLTIKVLKRGRSYIIALTLLMTNPEFKTLREYFNYPHPGEEDPSAEKKRDKGDRF